MPAHASQPLGFFDPGADFFLLLFSFKNFPGGEKFIFCLTHAFDFSIFRWFLFHSAFLLKTRKGLRGFKFFLWLDFFVYCKKKYFHSSGKKSYQTGNVEQEFCSRILPAFEELCDVCQQQRVDLDLVLQPSDAATVGVVVVPVDVDDVRLLVCARCFHDPIDLLLQIY